MAGIIPFRVPLRWINDALFAEKFRRIITLGPIAQHGNDLRIRSQRARDLQSGRDVSATGIEKLCLGIERAISFGEVEWNERSIADER